MATLDSEKIEELLKEFNEHRLAIKSMIDDLEVIRGKFDKLIPDNFDARFKMVFEERVKTITSFYSSMLEMRKEITKSIKDEVDIRRKIRLDDKQISIEEMLDVSKFADKVYEMNQKRKKIVDDSEYITKRVDIEELEIEVPEMTNKEISEEENERNVG